MLIPFLHSVQNWPGRIAQFSNGIIINIIWCFVAESEKDTKEEDLVEVTFKPKLCTFEQDIMKSLNIKEGPKPAKTYWY